MYFRVTKYCKSSTYIDLGVVPPLMRIGSHSQEKYMNGMCTWPLTVQKRDIEVSSEHSKGVCVITGCYQGIVVQCFGNQNFNKLCDNYTKVKFKSKDDLLYAPMQMFL